MAAPYTIFATTGDYDSIRTLAVDCTGLLNDGELLVTAAEGGGDPAYPAATTSAGLTIDSIVVNSTDTEMGGRSVLAGQGLFIYVEAPTAGEYTIRIFMKTDASTPQRPIAEIELTVVA